MNLAELSDAVRTRIGVPAGDTFYTDPVVADLVNEALAAISAESDWPWLEATTTFALANGTATYTPPTDWVATRSLCIDGFDAMEPRSLIEIREWPTTIVDIPRYFNINAETITLRPVPGAVNTVTHDYLKYEPALAAPSAAPLMPSSYHYSIVAFACHLAYLRTGDVQRASAALADYAGWVKRMAERRLRQRGGIRVRVRPGGGFA